MAAEVGTADRIKRLLSSFLHLEETEDSDVSSDDVIIGPVDGIARAAGNGTLVASQSKPRDREAFYRRVHTFTPLSWFAKPLWLSPMHCARYGWENVDDDILRCVSCHVLLSGKMPSSYQPQVYQGCCKRLSQSLTGTHHAFCPWSSNPSPECFLALPYCSRSETLLEFRKQMKELLKLGHSLPINPQFLLQNLGLSESILHHLEGLMREGTEAGEDDAEQNNDVLHAACVASLCGWKSRYPEDGETFHCQYCNRKLGLWNYFSLKAPTLEDSGVEEEEEEQSEDGSEDEQLDGGVDSHCPGNGDDPCDSETGKDCMSVHGTEGGEDGAVAMETENGGDSRTHVACGGGGKSEDEDETQNVEAKAVELLGNESHREVERTALEETQADEPVRRAQSEHSQSPGEVREAQNEQSKSPTELLQSECQQSRSESAESFNKVMGDQGELADSPMQEIQEGDESVNVQRQSESSNSPAGVELRGQQPQTDESSSATEQRDQGDIPMQEKAETNSSQELPAKSDTEGEVVQVQEQCEPGAPVGVNSPNIVEGESMQMVQSESEHSEATSSVSVVSLDSDSDVAAAEKECSAKVKEEVSSSLGNGESSSPKLQNSSADVGSIELDRTLIKQTSESTERVKRPFHLGKAASQEVVVKRVDDGTEDDEDEEEEARGCCPGDENVSQVVGKAKVQLAGVPGEAEGAGGNPEEMVGTDMERSPVRGVSEERSGSQPVTDSTEDANDTKDLSVEAHMVDNHDMVVKSGVEDPCDKQKSSVEVDGNPEQCVHPERSPAEGGEDADKDSGNSTVEANLVVDQEMVLESGRQYPCVQRQGSEEVELSSDEGGVQERPLAGEELIEVQEPEECDSQGNMGKGAAAENNKSQLGSEDGEACAEDAAAAAAAAASAAAADKDAAADGDAAADEDADGEVTTDSAKRRHSSPERAARREHRAKKRKLKIARIYFNPLTEHRPWCPWVYGNQPICTYDNTTGSSNTHQSDEEAGECLPGWKSVLHWLVPDTSPRRSSAITQIAKTTPPHESLRSIRRIFKEWTSTS